MVGRSVVWSVVWSVAALVAALKDVTKEAVRKHFSERYALDTQNSGTPGDCNGLSYPLLGFSVAGIAGLCAVGAWLLFEVYIGCLWLKRTSFHTR